MAREELDGHMPDLAVIIPEQVSDTIERLDSALKGKLVDKKVM